MIGALLAHSLLEASVDGLRLHPLVRAIAIEQPEANEAAERHRRWFLGFLATHGARIETADRVDAVATLRAADADVRAAVEASRDDVAGLIPCGDAIRAWGGACGQSNTLARWLEPAATRAPRLALVRALLLDGVDARRALGAVDVAALSPLERARCFAARAVADAHAGDPAAARWVAEAEAAADTIEARLSTNTAATTVAWRLGRPSDALAAAEACVELAREVEDPNALRRAYESAALVHYERGAHAEARAAYTQSLAIAERHAFVWGIATAHNGLGNLARTASRLDEAREHYTLALANLEQVGAVTAVAVVRFNLSIVLREAGELDEAERLTKASLDLASRANLLSQVIDAFSGLGRIEMIRRRPDRARSWFEAAVAHGRGQGAPETMLWRPRWNVGVAAWRTGALEDAAHELEALRHQRLVSDATIVGQLSVLIACVLAERRDPLALARLVEGLETPGWSATAVQEGLPFAAAALVALGHPGPAADVLALARPLKPTGFSRQVFDEAVAATGARAPVPSPDPLGAALRIVRALGS